MVREITVRRDTIGADTRPPAAYAHGCPPRGLALSRFVGESIILDTSDGRIAVTVVQVRGDKVRLSVDAPRHVRVDRAEIDAARRTQEVRHTEKLAAGA